MKLPNQVLEPKSINRIPRYCNFLAATFFLNRDFAGVAVRKLQYLRMWLVDFGSKT
jgi:hypothetical protein